MTNIQSICSLARNASFELSVADKDKKNSILNAIADFIVKSEKEIIKANDIDLQNANNLSDAMKDRLRLTPQRILSMAEGARQVASLEDPIGSVVESWTRPNGLKINKVKAPLGVVAVIYESRPNVTIDVASLCIKSGNCVILRGGKEAVNSNRILYNIIKKAIQCVGFSSDIVGFVDDTTRESALELLLQGDSVDVVIPRGGEGLKKFVLGNATMPVIASSGGNCHIYVDKTADLKMAVDIIFNAKMSRPSACNAAEQLLVDREIASQLLPMLAKVFDKKCVLNGSLEATEICPTIALADNEEYKKEHLDYVLTVYIVDGINEAIDRINANNTKHSEAIVSQNQQNIDAFTCKIDAACVYVNTSTRFTDGFEFGFGAEIGNSTQKLHARGPLGVRQLTSEKYIVCGNGQIRI